MKEDKHLGFHFPNVKYEGLSFSDAQEVSYFLKNCLELSEGNFNYLKIKYKDGLLQAQGLDFDRAIKYFESRLFYDGKSLAIFTTIKEGEEEPYSVTDTFYFLPDNIEVVSSTPFMEQKVSRTIEYISLHRKL